MPRLSFGLWLVLVLGCGESAREVYTQGMKAEGEAERGPCKLVFDPQLGENVISADQIQSCLKGQEEALALSDRCVAAYPSPIRSYENDGLASLPIVFCRRETGALIQRVLFDSPVTALTVRMAPGSVVIATQEEGWALGSRPTMDDARAGR